MEDQKSIAFVRFYERAVEHPYESEQAGRPIARMADYVRIEYPGNNLNVIDTLAADHHKKAYPVEWARYQNEKTTGDIQGTLLHDWNILNAAQVHEMKHFKFYTVEQVAGASDAQIATLGMTAGMSPLALREKAKAFLTTSRDTALAQAQAKALLEKDEQLAAMQKQINELVAAQAKPDKKAKQTEAA
jgi:hypothetical protein